MKPTNFLFLSDHGWNKIENNLMTASFVLEIQGVCILADSGFFLNFLNQGGVKSTVSWVFEDLKFKISEGYDQNWCFPDCAQLAVSV